MRISAVFFSLLIVCSTCLYAQTGETDGKLYAVPASKHKQVVKTEFIKVLNTDSMVVMDGDSISLVNDSISRVSPEDSIYKAANEAYTQYYIMKVNPSSDRDAAYNILLEVFMNYIKSMSTRNEEELEIIKDHIRKIRPEFEEAGIHYNQLGNNNKAYRFIECYLNIPRLPFYQGENFMRNLNYPNYVYLAATGAHNSRDYEASVSFFQEYIELGEKAYQEKCYEFLAKDLDFLKRWEDEATVLDEGLMNYPNNIEMLKTAIVLHTKTHNTDEAEVMLDRALAISPGDPDLLLHKATVNDKKGNFAEALPIYQRFFAADSTNLGLKERLAVCHYNLAGTFISKRNKAQDGDYIKRFSEDANKNYEQAIKLLSEILDEQQIGKKDYKLLYALKDAYKQTGKEADAKRIDDIINGGLYVDKDSENSVPNFNDWYKPKLESILAEWEKRGEFEPAADYVQRVNPESRKMLIMETRQECETLFIQEYGGYFNLDDLTIKPYDPDHETFRIQTRQGNIYLKVPLANDEAKEFKDNWNGVKIINPKLRVDKAGNMLLAMADVITPNGKIYKYDVNLPLVYGKVKIAQPEWDENDLLWAGDNTGGNKKDDAKIIDEPLNVGESIVDINIPQTKNENGNTFALIFANEKYKNVEEVPYALNDGRVFKQYCQNVLGVQEEHIVYLENATGNEMIAAIGRIQEFASVYEGVNLLVYYSGHGVPNPSTSEAYLLPSDASPRHIEQTGYKLSRFYKELATNSPNSVTVFLDACFSGVKKNGEVIDKEARGVAIAPAEEMPATNMIVFSACTGMQTAYPYENQKHGMFTFYLLRKLQEDKGKTTYQELEKYISENVKKKSLELRKKIQSPTVQTMLPKDTWKNWRLDKER